MIGKALGSERLRMELKETDNYEVRSLLLGMDSSAAYHIKYYTKEMEVCDVKIAQIFGGSNAVAAANGFEPEGLALIGKTYYRGDNIFIWRDGTEVIGPGHLSRHVMHMYGSTDGTRLGVDGETYTDVYIPNGFEMNSRVKYENNKNALTQIPTPEQSIVRFYYKKIGNVSDATLMMMHIKNFKAVKVGDRWKIGSIGGKGGESADSDLGYLH